MGVSRATAEFLVQARARGVDFARTATIGRQELFIGPGRVRRLLRDYDLWPAGMSRGALDARFEAAPGFLDPLLLALGAEEIRSIDASDYEGADIVHDLNEPAPEELHRRFSVLFDGGSLEHIFNVPAALRSYMQMVEVGGHLLIHTMANNYFGHGFYQFGPDLFYRALSPENGYEVERVLLVENDLLWTKLFNAIAPVEVEGRWAEAHDPSAFGRILLQTARPVVVQVQARRVADVPIFATPPQQSDYAAQWSADGDEPPAAPSRPFWDRLNARLPVPRQLDLQWDVLPRLFALGRPLRERRERADRSLDNRRWYRRVK
jgi:hypothetical protein